MLLKKIGLQKTTLIDYPGLVASTVFTYGCNLRCPYCHNPELVKGGIPEEFLNTDDFFKFLDKRKKVLDGVCITGGEPLLNDDLPDFIDRIHSFGLKVKLDTNGTLPEKLKDTSADYVAMDLKTVPRKYPKLLGGGDSAPEKIIESIEYLKTSGIQYEIRTTWVSGITEKEDIPEMARYLKGVENYYITLFRPGVTLEPSFAGILQLNNKSLLDIQNTFLGSGIRVRLRNY